MDAQTPMLFHQDQIDGAVAPDTLRRYWHLHTAGLVSAAVTHGTQHAGASQQRKVSGSGAMAPGVPRVAVTGRLLYSKECHKERRMSDPVLDAFARRAATATSRRLPMRVLGGAALAAGLARAIGTAAKQSPARKVKRKNRRRCNQVRNECRSIVLAVPNPDVFTQIALSCCGHCFAMDWQACVDAALDSLGP